MDNTLRFSSLLLSLLCLFLACAGLAAVTSPYMGVASFAYFLMVLGMIYRKKDRQVHRGLMFSAMGLDLTLVLLLEVLRNAVGTVIALELAPLQFAHVLFSTLALALYGPMIFLGKKLWNTESAATRRKHRWLGILAFVFRSLGFLLMFSLLDRPMP